MRTNNTRSSRAQQECLVLKEVLLLGEVLEDEVRRHPLLPVDHTRLLQAHPVPKRAALQNRMLLSESLLLYEAQEVNDRRELRPLVDCLRLEGAQLIPRRAARLEGALFSKLPGTVEGVLSKFLLWEEVLLTRLLPLDWVLLNKLLLLEGVILGKLLCRHGAALSLDQAREDKGWGCLCLLVILRNLVLASVLPR